MRKEDIINDIKLVLCMLFFSFMFTFLIKCAPKEKSRLSDVYINKNYASEHGGGKVDNNPLLDYFYYNLYPDGEIIEKYRIDGLYLYTVSVNDETHDLRIPFKMYNSFIEGDYIKLHLKQKISKINGNELEHEYSIYIGQ